MVDIIQSRRSSQDALDAGLRSWCLEHKVPAVLTDHIEANALWGANCGPMSLAAVLGFSTVELARPLVEPFRGYMNPTDMLKALQAAGFEVESKRVIQRRTPWPKRGVVRIQWKGPWCDEGVDPRAAYRHTHWIGVRRPTLDEAADLGLSNRELLVYDATPNRWVPMTVWAAWCPSLWPRGTADWYVASCFELDLSDDRKVDHG